VSDAWVTAQEVQLIFIGQQKGLSGLYRTGVKRSERVGLEEFSNGSWAVNGSAMGAGTALNDLTPPVEQPTQLKIVRVN
jgi:hypothetical protein